MNIAKLKEIIKDLPDSMDVFIGERISDFKYGYVKVIDFKEEPQGETLASDEVLILEEE